ncbi:MAG TPA: helix-turn-helix domain-containing protein [Pseudolysinimonas sp.]|nr:helix-turn-helix domain-containing protein [Pseudolysinimonas sp.]
MDNSVRFDDAPAWERCISESFFPLVMNDVTHGEFHATINTVDLPRGMRVSQVEVVACHLRRTERLVRESNSDHALVLFQSTGRAKLRQGGRQVTLSGGAATIADPSEPYDVMMTSNSHQMVLLVPTSSLRTTGLSMEDVRARLLPADSLSLRTLTALAAGVDDRLLSGDEAEGVAAAAFDLLRGAIRTAGVGAIATTSLSHEVQLRLVKQFILEHLNDPNLNLESIARSQHMSVRHLTAIFGDGESPGAFVRRERLARIYDELADPLSVGRSVAEIGRNWGMLNHASLCRAFARAFGVTPTEARAAAHWAE